MNQTRPEYPRRLAKAVREIFVNTVKVCLELFKIMIPIIIVVKILNEMNLIHYLAAPLAPLMRLAGLPPETGLVWATSMLSNIYSGIVVYISLPLSAPLSVAQVTVLSLMILVAHSLILECNVTSRCGAKFWYQLVYRIVAGFIFGIVLHLLCSAFNLGQETSRAVFTPTPPAATLLAWALGELKNLGGIFMIIFSLMSLMRVLGALGVTQLMNRLLGPVLRLLGIGKDAATVTVVGLTLGLTYGSGLIIHEARSGRVSARDVMFSVSLMGLSHALIEDTLLMSLLGASFYGTFWARLIFSLIGLAILSKVIGGQAWQRWMSPLPKAE